jgi:hypothetical protein
VIAAPFVARRDSTAAPSETLYHASIGAAGMAAADIAALTASPHVKLIAVADVDRRNLGPIKERFPSVKTYEDWRELFDKEKSLTSVNVSTPDHMHAPVTMRALQQGLNVYTQKPLTHTVHEARQLARVAREKSLVTQMGIQIHSHEIHRTIVATIQAGTIGKIKEVHSWSGKYWGDNNPRPRRADSIPPELNWNLWLGVASERPYLANYYHPSEWRKRLDFGTGTFGDMGCHILDPVFTALALTAPKSIRSEGAAPTGGSWALHSQVRYLFPGTRFTQGAMPLYWYDGDKRPPDDVKHLLGKRPLADQGSIFIGTAGVLYAPYIDPPELFPVEKFKDTKLPSPGGFDHYLEFVEGCRGNRKTSAPFAYSGPLTESVLLGCLATKFPAATLEWDSANLKITNFPKANTFLRRRYRKGWAVEEL